MSEPTPGRPRSEAARQAVLEAVDDLLVEIGYAAMTMKNIAERAGVGRPTVYRWWASKAEILLEACVEDAATELATEARHVTGSTGSTDPGEVLAGYLGKLARFLIHEPPGLAYRALLGEAQHDPAVADLLRRNDVLGPPTAAVLRRLGMEADEFAVLRAVAPVVLHVLTTSAEPSGEDLRRHAGALPGARS